jgi:hypothetical protein
MFDARSSKRLIILLAMLGACIGTPAPSMAAMVRPAVPDHVIQAVRDQSQQSRTNPKTSTAKKKPAQAAKKQGKERKSPGAGTPQQSTRNPSGIPPAGERRYLPNEVVVELAGATTSQQIDALARRFRLVNVEAVNFQLGGTTLVRFRIPDRRSVTVVIRALETDASVLFAQPNYLYALVEARASAPAAGARDGDPAQYMLEKMRVREAHQLARGNKVLVAVIDSGVDAAHPDLGGDVIDTFDAIGTGVAVHAHGTAIAGGIAARGRLLGVAPAAQILAVRAFSGLGRSENGTTFAIMKGLDWAVLRGARIINMSFSGPRDPGVTRGIAAAHGKDTILVAAAGNKGASSPPLFPAADRNVIAVTSTDRQDQLPAFANRGPHVAVAAPGVDLIMLAPNDGLQRQSGTSFSAAYVTGTVALMLERKPGLSPDAAREALMKSARQLGTRPDQAGAGLVDAHQAVLAVTPKESSETVATPAANRQ